MNKEVKHALAMAIVWTFSAIFAILTVLCRDARPLQAVVAVLFTFDAAIWWVNYMRKRRKEDSGEEKENS